VLRVPNGEFQGVDFDVDLLDLEERPGVVLGGYEVYGDVNSFTTNDNVCETRILEFEPRLLLEVESNVAHVGLHLREGDDKLMARVIVYREMELEGVERS
jgi:hypothetical protein